MELLSNVVLLNYRARFNNRERGGFVGGTKRGSGIIVENEVIECSNG